MAEKKTILIADPDKGTLKQLRDGLGADYEILLARDGSKALELSVLKYPDLVIFYRGTPLISAGQFLRILRTNPRTEDVPLIILSDEPIASDSLAPSFLQGVLIKPLNLDEVRSYVAAVLRKAETAKQVGHEEGAVSGSLDHISMVDLLQVFSVNRRTGCVRLSRGRPGEEAEVYLHDGRIEEACVGVTRGQKALFRLLMWSGGRFTFVPSSRASRVSISSSTDSLLMEGMRQGDELCRIADSIPNPRDLLERLVPPEGLPEGLHPVTAEIYQLAEFYPRVGELIDRAGATDMAVCVALKSLIDAGLLRAVEGIAPTSAESVMTQEGLLALRSRLRRAGLPPVFLNAPKIAVLAARAEDIWQFGVALSRLHNFSAGDLERLHRLPLGAIGTLRLDSTMAVDFFAIASDERLLPLAFGLSAGTVAAIVLGTADLESVKMPLALLESERRAPLLWVRRPGEPIPLMEGGTNKRVVLDVSELGDRSIGEVLSTLFAQVVGMDLRGVSL